MIPGSAVQVKYKRLLFSVHDFFLTSSLIADSDINYFIQCPVNIENKLSEFYTLVIDLNKTEEQIKADIHHRTVSEINSFLSNQDFDYNLLSEISDKELESFIQLFNEFARVKKIRKAEAFRLRAYNRNKILAISYIRQKDQFCCINFYRITKERALNLSSFIVKDSPGNNSQKGRAHRALHWLDIREFKKSEVAFYDFGGWYEGQTDKELLNINSFKEQFTKHKIKEYSGVIYKNKLLIFLLKLFK